MENFNKLIPSQTERLSLLLEELGETQQAIGKILRHGYESYHPDIPETDNREDLEKEIGHIKCALDFMYQANDINESDVDAHRLAKRMKIHKYLHHQG